MYNHNKAQQSINRVHISWDILYVPQIVIVIIYTTAAWHLCGEFTGDRLIPAQVASNTESVCI